MERFMKRFIRRSRRSFHYGEKGFTLIELLIVMVILGIIAAVVALNVGGFLGAGELQAANTEAHQVRVAVIAYMVDEDKATLGPVTVGGLGGEGLCDAYLDGGEDILKAAYTVDTSEACIITEADAIEGGWSDAIDWDSLVECAWVKS